MQDPAPLKDPAQPPAEPSREDAGQESARSETAEFRTMSAAGTPASGTGEEDEPDRPDAAADDAQDDADDPEPTGTTGGGATDDTGAETGPQADTATGGKADDGSGEAATDDAEEDKPAFSALVFDSAGRWTVPAPGDDTPATETPTTEPPAPETPAAETPETESPAAEEREAAEEETPAPEPPAAEITRAPETPEPETSVGEAAGPRPGDEPEGPEPQAPTPQDEAPGAADTDEGPDTRPGAADTDDAEPGDAEPDDAEPDDAGPEAATPADRPRGSAAPTVPEIDRRIAPRVAPETVPEIDVAAARPKRPLPPPPTVDDLDPLGIGVLPQPGRDDPGTGTPRRGPAPPQPEPEPEPAPQADLAPRAEPAPAPRPEPAPAPHPESAPERAPERAPEPQPEPAREPEPASEPEATPPSAFYEEAAPRREAPQQRPSVPGPATADAEADAWAGWPQASHAAPAAPSQQRPPQQHEPPQHRLPFQHPAQQPPPQEHLPQEYPPQERLPQERPPEEHAPQEHLPHGYAAPSPHQERQRSFGPVQDYGPPPQYGPPLEENRQEEQQAFGDVRDFAAAYEAAASEAEGRKKKRRRLLISLVLVLVLLAGGAAGQLLRPVPEPRMRLTLPTAGHTFPGSAPVLPLPAHGQAALYVEGIGPMGASGATTPTPTASVAKVMTAYVFLRDHPLAPGQDGPTFTVSPQAVAQMPARRQRGESLLGITLGMRLTQRKALEALMIISANDVAHELARWDSGNPAAFVQKMNDTARALGMTSTRYSDPSGYDSGTVSTAADQVKLLRAAMAVPAFVEIVSKRYYVPHDGGPPRPGGNILIGQYGVFGGKTGYTDAAGGNFVFAARRRVGGVDVLFLGAVMGQRSPSAVGAIKVSRDLLAAAQRTLTTATLAQAGAQVGRVDDGLGGSTPVRAAAPVTVVGWPGLTVRLQVEGDPPRRAAEGTRVGAVKAGATKVPLELGQRLEEPSLLKRLLRLG